MLFDGLWKQTIFGKTISCHCMLFVYCFLCSYKRRFKLSGNFLISRIAFLSQSSMEALPDAVFAVLRNWAGIRGAELLGNIHGVNLLQIVWIMSLSFLG